jgi:hypothetical protein
MTSRLATVAEVGDRVPDLLARPEVTQDIDALNSALCSRMTKAGRAVRFQGLHFYRHMQQQPLVEAKLRTRSDQMRRNLLGWLGTARHALVIGYDTGHLLLSALHLSPTVKITATDAGRWPVDGDEDPPERNRYVPMARDWLASHFSDRLRIAAQPESEVLASVKQDGAPAAGFDLVLFADVDIHALSTLMATRDLMARDAVVVAASATGDAGRRFADRLRLQGLCLQVIADKHFGDDRGSLSVFQLDGKDG